MSPSGSISMTRLLNWTAIRMFPGLLKWLPDCAARTGTDESARPARSVARTAAVRARKALTFIGTVRMIDASWLRNTDRLRWRRAAHPAERSAAVGEATRHAGPAGRIGFASPVPA